MPTRRATLALSAAALMFPAPALADPAAEAKAVTVRLLGDARAALTGGDRGPALRRVIEAAFDFEIWERFLLQKRGDAFSDAERAEFRALLPGFLAYLYEQRFDQGMTTPPTVGDTSKVRRDYLVASRFARPNGEALPVDWRLRQGAGGMRVIDIMVAGTSFLLLKRDEFMALIDQGGADALLTHMREHAL